MAADSVSGKLPAALQTARDADPAILEHWSEADKALFRDSVAYVEAVHKDFTLSQLNDKVARQSILAAQHPADKCCVTGGNLSYAAMLHASLKALRNCQLEATRRERAEREKLDAESAAWLQPLLDTRGEAAPTFADARGLGHLHDASAPLAFLEHWTEPDKALFYSFVADQEALHQHCSLPDLNDKIVRQSRHTTRHTRDELRVTDGKLSVAAMLHATLLALRKCIPIATLKAQAEHEKPSEGAKVLLQASDTAFRVRNKVTPAPATTEPSTYNAEPAQNKQKSSATAAIPSQAKEAANAVLPQLGAGERNRRCCDTCWLHFPASELNFSSDLGLLVCTKCRLTLVPEAPPATTDAATGMPSPPAALAVPPDASGNGAAALATSMEPGSACGAAVAVLASVSPGGLPLSEVLRRALALGLFTPQLPAAGGSADVAAWAEMSAALLSDDLFITLSPGVFALRSLLPRGTKGMQRPATVQATPVATLSKDELRARLAASPTLRGEADALLRSTLFHRAAREARTAGDATALAQHFAKIHPERELARSPDVYLALANGNYEGIELELLWGQLNIAAIEMSKGQLALKAERERRIAAETRALEAIKRAVAAEEREAEVSRRAVAIVRRAGMDPYNLLFAHDAEVGEGGGASHGGYDEAAVVPQTAGVQEPDALIAGDDARASTPVPAEEEEEVCAALPPPGADAVVTGDAPPKPPEEAMHEAAAAGFGTAEPSPEAPHVSNTALDPPAAAVEELVQQAAPSLTAGDTEPMDDDRRKRDASELLAAEEPQAKAARVDEPPQAAPPCGSENGDDAAAVHHLGEEEVDAPLAAPVSSHGGICADQAAGPALAAPSDNARPADITDSTAAAAPKAPDAADPATAGASQMAPQLLGQMCLCNAVLAASAARGDVMVNCSTCAQPFHPACCGYPASMSAAAAAAMRPPFACYDHRVYFPSSQQYE